MGTILVTGALGQIGTELVPFLCGRYGRERIIATDLRDDVDFGTDCRFRKLDVSSYSDVSSIIEEEDVSEIFHLAGILSATGEKKPELAFSVNMVGTHNILESSVEHGVNRILIPSTIGVFGRGTPKQNTPVETIIRPTTMYGITKYAGELLGEYFHRKFSLDVRGLRFPGIISYKTAPTAGTTDYSVEMFLKAIRGERYTCYLRPDTLLPMMYMPDAIGSMVDLFEADGEKLTRRTDYHVSAYSLTPAILAEKIREHIPDLDVDYRPDFRQEIADMWPESLDCSISESDWGFRASYGLDETVSDMIGNLRREPDA